MKSLVPGFVPPELQITAVLEGTSVPATAVGANVTLNTFEVAEQPDVPKLVTTLKKLDVVAVKAPICAEVNVVDPAAAGILVHVTAVAVAALSHRIVPVEPVTVKLGAIEQTGKTVGSVAAIATVPPAAVPLVNTVGATDPTPVVHVLFIANTLKAIELAP